MKKASKVSLSLGLLGVSMIGASIFLQYRSFQMEKEESVIYEKVTMKDLSSGTIEKLSKKETNTTENNTDTIEETVSDPLATTTETPTEEVEVQDEVKEITTYEDVSTTPVEEIVYDGMTLNQLAEKLNRSLKSTIAGKGYLIASYSLQLGVDPYLATAIILHETGCNSGTCSNLVRSCNNVGGQKGGPSCGGGSYKAYPTLDEGIMGYIDNLYKNYVSKGLTTAEAMGPKYAASTTWASQVNNYIALVKNK